MLYLIAAIVVCWIVGFFLLKNAGDLKSMERLRAAQEEMEAATSGDEKRRAAREIIDLIEQEHLAGVLVDDARKDAETVLRVWPGS